jgi:hypothetical protein
MNGSRQEIGPGGTVRSRAQCGTDVCPAHCGRSGRCRDLPSPPHDRDMGRSGVSADGWLMPVIFCGNVHVALQV